MAASAELLVSDLVISLVSGTKFLCSEVIALIRSEVDDICLQIINFEDLSSPPPPQPAIPQPTQANNRLATRCTFQFYSFHLDSPERNARSPESSREARRDTATLSRAEDFGISKRESEKGNRKRRANL